MMNFFPPLLNFSIPGKWLGRKKESQGRRTAGKQNPAKKAKRTGTGIGITAGDVAGHRDGAEAPAAEESV